MPADGTPRRFGAKRSTVGAGAMVLAGWVILIVVASGEQPVEKAWLGLDHIDTVMAVVFGLMALVGLVLLVLLNPFSNEWKPRSKQRFNFWILPLVVLALVLWGPDIISKLSELQADVADLTEATATPDVVPISEEDLAVPPTPVAQLSELLLVGVIGLALGGLVWWARRRGEVAVDALDALSFEEELLRAMEHASVALETTDDPRQAILFAYNALERMLATRGLPRTQAETTTEHLRRSLRDVRVDERPLLALGDLYELARFSEQPITREQQQRAAASLAHAQAELERGDQKPDAQQPDAQQPGDQQLGDWAESI